MKVMKKYIQQHIKNIKTFFYTLVGVNCSDDIDEEKYKFIILSYYQGDTDKFMEEKEEYENKILRIKELVSKTKSHVIGYSEFIELKDLLNELKFFKTEEFNSLLKKYNYDFEKLYENIIDLKDKSQVDKIKTSEIIGNLSGTTLQNQYLFKTNYDEFIKKIKSNE